VSVLNTPNPPLVHSVSYDEFEDQLSPDFMRRGDEEFMKAGVRGLTILFASGDFGTGCNASSLPAKFAPEWPPSSPYITSVGGTSSPSAKHVGLRTTEAAWAMSGGGFSYYAPQPSYQASAVAVYIKNTQGLPPAKFFNPSNRGFPDVAAWATEYSIVFEGQTAGVSGTSASTPTWAGVFSLLNDLRLNAGKAPLGFANPFLYAHPECLNDTTIGANDGVGCFDANGFPAARGWDAATGLGTPVFGCLAAAALGLD
jgi:tripeptidyl-peptidase-1